MEWLFFPLAPLYVALGLLAGLTGGLFGLGGGVVLVPALLFVFHRSGFPSAYLMQMAVATSLLTIVFTNASAAWTHHRHQNVSWSVVGALTPGILIGAGLGSWVIGVLSSQTLRYLFGFFETLIAVRLWFGREPPLSSARPGPWLPVAGVGVGALSVVMGIGGGTLIVPLLLLYGQGTRRAIGASSACGLALALAGSIALAALYWRQPGLPEGNIGFVHWPAALYIVVGSVLGAHGGALLANRLPVATLRRLFAIVLLLVGVRMLWPS